MHTRYLEDFEVGQTFETRAASLSQSQIMDFAMLYDPQLIHTDIAGAKDGPFGGIIASGLHTFCIGFRLFLDLGLINKSNLGGPGIDELRWTRPVRPGDTLTSTVEVVEVRESQSKPDRGSVRFLFTVANQTGETVCTFDSTSILKRRP
ncbi:MAG: MaoC family dehydratase [Alphaproteobacteria bacterium]|jgi:acyl dehydratase|nr:MaoC family dehydratase [Alphaproteobacteria bacterium]|tara:strand:- start:276 stop:722 length:447 start_codon:yes stop_codon:yes gene_type:complete